MDAFEQEILDEFVVEAGELLGNAEEDIIELENDAHLDYVNRIFRAFHTVKGNASMLGLDGIANLAHHSEDILTRVRSRKLKPNKRMIDLLLVVIDTLKQLLTDARDQNESYMNVEDLVNELMYFGRPPSEPTGQAVKETTPSTEPAPQAEPPAPVEIPIPKAPPPPPPPPERLNILVVEDDFVSREMLKMMLSKYGDVHIAVNGEEAVTAVKLSLTLEKAEPYHLICMDIMMPEMDGMEAARRIRDVEKNSGCTLKNEVVIIMTTALDDPKTVIRSLYKCGATSYMVKPIERIPLEKELKKHQLI